jgi:hypothetical protein
MLLDGLSSGHSRVWPLPLRADKMRRFLFIAANEWKNWGGSELLWSRSAEKLARKHQLASVHR